MFDSEKVKNNFEDFFCVQKICYKPKKYVIIKYYILQLNKWSIRVKRVLKVDWMQCLRTSSSIQMKAGANRI